MDIHDEPPIDKQAYLSDIIETNPNSLKAAIAKEALDHQQQTLAYLTCLAS